MNFGNFYLFLNYSHFWWLKPSKITRNKVPIFNRRFICFATQWKPRTMNLAFFIFLFFHSHFWWLKPSKIKLFFFFQKFSFDFTFWWNFNNTKIHCWKSYWKALGEISWCIFEGHLISINMPMLLLCWLFDFFFKSLVLAFWKFWNQWTCLVFHNHQHSNITSNKNKLLNNLVVFCHTILWFKSVLEHPSFI